MTKETSKSLFTIKSIGIATYLAGPVAGGWLIAVNFNRLNKKAKRNEILCYSIAFTILLIALAFMVPEGLINHIPKFLIPAIYTPLLTFYAHKFQGESIKDHVEKGGVKGSGWAVFGISLTSFAAFMVLVFGLGFFLSPSIEPYEFEGEIYHYGEQAHLIYHNDVDSEVLTSCGDFLLSAEYLRTSYQGIIQVHREGDKHHVYLTFSKDYWNNDDFLEFAGLLKKGLQEVVFKKEIELTLTDEDYLEVYRKKI